MMPAKRNSKDTPAGNKKSAGNSSSPARESGNKSKDSPAGNKKSAGNSGSPVRESDKSKDSPAGIKTSAGNSSSPARESGDKSKDSPVGNKKSAGNSSSPARESGNKSKDSPAGIKKSAGNSSSPARESGNKSKDSPVGNKKSAGNSGSPARESDKSEDSPAGNTELGKGGAFTPFRNREAREDFYRWFWTGKNGNELIEDLNAHCYDQNSRLNPDRIRREADPPVIYCIVINDDGIAGSDWKLCKVGYTRQPTDKGTNNRMEQVMKEIERVYKKASVIFALPIRAIDTTPHFEIEDHVRGYVGFTIHKDVAKDLKLPVPTEWVLTTQPYLTFLRDDLNKMPASDRDTQVFKNRKYRFRQDEKVSKCPPKLCKINIQCSETEKKSYVIEKCPEE